MIECPECSRLTELKRHCSHCGAVVSRTVEEKFQMLAESVHNALKEEAGKRKRKKQIQYSVCAAVILAAVGIGLLAAR